MFNKSLEPWLLLARRGLLWDQRARGHETMPGTAWEECRGKEGWAAAAPPKLGPCSHRQQEERKALQAGRVGANASDSASTRYWRSPPPRPLAYPQTQPAPWPLIDQMPPPSTLAITCLSSRRWPPIWAALLKFLADWPVGGHRPSDRTWACCYQRCPELEEAGERERRRQAEARPKGLFDAPFRSNSVILDLVPCRNLPDF